MNPLCLQSLLLSYAVRLAPLPPIIGSLPGSAHPVRGRTQFPARSQNSRIQPFARTADPHRGDGTSNTIHMRIRALAAPSLSRESKIKPRHRLTVSNPVSPAQPPCEISSATKALFRVPIDWDGLLTCLLPPDKRHRSRISIPITKRVEPMTRLLYIVRFWNTGQKVPPDGLNSTRNGVI